MVFDAVYWQAKAEELEAEIERLRKLVVEADAFISHMLYRESWPGERYDVERLIAKLRPYSTEPREGAAP